MRVNTVVVGQLGVNCYIVSDGSSPEAVIIDPGDEHDKIESAVAALGLTPVSIVLTHAHYDHICAAGDLRERYNIPILMHEDDRETYRRSKELCISWGLSPSDFPADYQTMKSGDKISAGRLSLEVIHTPGHTPGGVSLYGNRTVFTGDTLFKGAVGRTDLPGGNTARLMESLKKLSALPVETRVLCGHGEETTMGQEIKSNPYLNEKATLKLYR
ncbi:MAG: MBL fold metallo-hydrolase [Nitrospirae bacterium]|nr:MBL fold metallo-hydrolase [Nitrospirota bacterium]